MPDLAPTSPRPRPNRGGDLRNRPRPHRPTTTWGEVELAPTGHHHQTHHIAPTNGASSTATTEAAR